MGYLEIVRLSIFQPLSARIARGRSLQPRHLRAFRERPPGVAIRAPTMPRRLWHTTRLHPSMRNTLLIWSFVLLVGGVGTAQTTPSQSASAQPRPAPAQIGPAQVKPAPGTLTQTTAAKASPVTTNAPTPQAEKVLQAQPHRSFLKGAPQLTFAEPKANELALARHTYSGIVVQVIKAKRPLQLLNPFAPPQDRLWVGQLRTVPGKWQRSHAQAALHQLLARLGLRPWLGHPAQAPHGQDARATNLTCLHHVLKFKDSRLQMAAIAEQLKPSHPLGPSFSIIHPPTF